MFQWWPTSNILLPKPAVQHTSDILVCHYLIFFFVLFTHLSELKGPIKIFYQHFLKTVIPWHFKLVLQNNFHVNVHGCNTFLKPMCIPELCSAVHS